MAPYTIEEKRNPEKANNAFPSPITSVLIGFAGGIVGCIRRRTYLSDGSMIGHAVERRTGIFYRRGEQKRSWRNQ